MPKKNSITHEEENEFRHAMRGTKRLTQTKIHHTPPAPRPKCRPPEPEAPTFFEFSDFEKLDPVSGDQLIFFSQPGIQHKVLRKLRTGQYNVNAVLDLHGMTVAKAKDALNEFLYACEQRDIRHALIIHGKGRDHAQPILKNKLNHWLRQTKQVLAFCSAMNHGRGGALYILLNGRK